MDVKENTLSLKSFCYIWAIDMAPTWAAPGLFNEIIYFAEARIGWVFRWVCCYLCWLASLLRCLFVCPLFALFPFFLRTCCFGSGHNNFVKLRQDREDYNFHSYSEICNFIYCTPPKSREIGTLPSIHEWESLQVSWGGCWISPCSHWGLLGQLPVRQRVGCWEN